VRGVDPGVAGVYVAPFMVGAVGGNLISGRRIGHTGRYRVWPIAGGVAALVGASSSGLTTVDTPLALMMTGAAILGFGIGFTMQTVLLVAQNEVELRDIGVATSSSFLARQMGGAIALAALGSVLNNRLAHWIPRLTPSTRVCISRSCAAVPRPSAILAPARRRRRHRRLCPLLVDGVLVPRPGGNRVARPRAVAARAAVAGDDAEQVEMLDDTGLAAIAVTDGHLGV
jgi:MFS family permease